MTQTDGLSINVQHSRDVPTGFECTPVMAQQPCDPYTRSVIIKPQTFRAVREKGTNCIEKCSLSMTEITLRNAYLENM